MGIRDEKIAELEKERDQLSEQYKAAKADARQALGGQRVGFEQQAEGIKKRYEKLNGKIERLRRGELLVTTPEELGQFKTDLRRDWEAELHRLNFDKPRGVFYELVCTQHRKAVLLLIQRSRWMKADSFFKRIRETLELDKQQDRPPFIGDFTGYGTGEGIIEKQPFIQRWCDDLRIDAADDSFAGRCEQVIRNLGQAVNKPGQTLCLDIRVEAISYSFLEWFLKAFWSPLANSVVTKGIKVLVVLAAEDSLTDDCLGGETCCSKDDFDPQRCLEVELHNWNQDDIEHWIEDHGNDLLHDYKLPLPEIPTLAHRVVRFTYGGVPLNAHNYILNDTLTDVVNHVKSQQHDQA